jgi:hypothetical protein
VTQIEAACITETAELAEYIKGSEDLLLQVVRTHQHIANAPSPCTAHKCKKNSKEKRERKRMHRQFPWSLDDMMDRNTPMAEIFEILKGKQKF